MVECIHLADYKPLTAVKIFNVYEDIQKYLRDGNSVVIVGNNDDLAFFFLITGANMSTQDKFLVHTPVMPKEVIEYLGIQPNSIIVDATAGGGGHTEKIASLIGPGGKVIAIDRDPDLLRSTARRLKPKSPHIYFKVGDFSKLHQILKSLDSDKVNGVLFDLGISSYHIERSGRGFSFRRDEILDMRFNPKEGVPCYEILYRLDEQTLYRVFKEYGEEPYARRIASAIVKQRRLKPIRRTTDLNEIIDSLIPFRRRIKTKMRIYQALRILVNDELNRVASGLISAIQSLKIGGRLVVLSYHSLEDRLVKALKNIRGLGTLTKKPRRPTDEEVTVNPRARSARLRAYKKLQEITNEELYICLEPYIPIVRGYPTFTEKF